MNDKEVFEKRRSRQKETKEAREAREKVEAAEILRTRKKFAKLCAGYHREFTTYKVEEWKIAKKYYQAFKGIRREHLKSGERNVLDHRMSYCAVMFLLAKVDVIRKFIAAFQTDYMDKGLADSSPIELYKRVKNNAKWKALNKSNTKYSFQVLTQAEGIIKNVRGNWGKSTAEFLKEHGDPKFDDPAAAQRLRRGIVKMRTNVAFLHKKKIEEKRRKRSSSSS